MRVLAPAKLNLGLYVGPVRADGLHEICSLFAPLSLADELTISGDDADRVDSPGVPGSEPDLTARALTALRAAGWEGGQVRIEVEKRIPVAAGLGGGSADAAAVLRLALGDLGGDRVAAIAAGLGADVPSQLDPRFCLVGGAGEIVEPMPRPAGFAAVLVPDREGLSTPAVYAEADRLGTPRDGPGLAAARERLMAAAGRGAHPLDYRELLVNDLAPAAVSLRPGLAATLERLEAAGAEAAFISGSGPTAVGLMRELAGAEAAAGELSAAGLEAIVVTGGGD